MRVLVEKVKLIAVLSANRAKHREVFIKALDNFRKHAQKVFEGNLQLLKEGKMPERYINFQVPTDETRQYDRAIALLEMATEDKVDLNDEDHRKFVLDQWDWSKQWKGTSNAYGHVVDDAED